MYSKLGKLVGVKKNFVGGINFNEVVASTACDIMTSRICCKLLLDLPSKS